MLKLLRRMQINEQIGVIAVAVHNASHIAIHAIITLDTLIGIRGNKAIIADQLLGGDSLVIYSSTV